MIDRSTQNGWISQIVISGKQSVVRSHLAVVSGSSLRGAEVFENANGLITSDGREVLEKFVERNAGLKIFKQGRNRNARSRKYRCTAHDLTVDGDRNIAFNRYHAVNSNIGIVPYIGSDLSLKPARPGVL